MSKSKRIGYNGEKLVADYLGLKRTGATGTQIYDLDGNDVYAGLLKVEVKSGKQVPKLVIHAFNQVLPHISGNQIPAVVMVPSGVGKKKLGSDAKVILRLKDFRKILDGLEINAPNKITVEMSSGETFVLNGDK